MEIPDSLLNWLDVISTITNEKNRDVAAARLISYEKGSLRGQVFSDNRQLTPEIWEDILSCLRGQVSDLPIRPPSQKAAPVLPLADREETPPPPVPYHWKWYNMPTAWTDAGGRPSVFFPLPVAQLSSSTLQGFKHLLSLTALFHLWGAHVQGNPLRLVGLENCGRYRFHFWGCWLAWNIDMLMELVSQMFENEIDVKHF